MNIITANPAIRTDRFMRECLNRPIPFGQCYARNMARSNPGRGPRGRSASRCSSGAVRHGHRRFHRAFVCFLRSSHETDRSNGLPGMRHCAQTKSTQYYGPSGANPACPIPPDSWKLSGTPALRTLNPGDVYT